jgi:hypothetical protein
MSRNMRGASSALCASLSHARGGGVAVVVTGDSYRQSSADTNRCRYSEHHDRKRPPRELGHCGHERCAILQATLTSRLAVAWQQYANICELVLSTICILHCRPSCLGGAKRCSQDLICLRSAIGLPNTSRLPAPPTWCLPRRAMPLADARSKSDGEIR